MIDLSWIVRIYALFWPDNQSCPTRVSRLAKAAYLVCFDRAPQHFSILMQSQRRQQSFVLPLSPRTREATYLECCII